MSNLLALSNALAYATGPDRGIDCQIALALDGFFLVPPRWDGDENGYGYLGEDGARILPGNGSDMLVPRYTSSVDAALALAERLTPAEPVLMGFRQSPETLPWARVGKWARPDATGATLAIAICLAAVYAKAAKGGDHA